MAKLIAKQKNQQEKPSETLDYVRAFMTITSAAGATYILATILLACSNHACNGIILHP